MRHLICVFIIFAFIAPASACSCLYKTKPKLYSEMHDVIRAEIIAVVSTPPADGPEDTACNSCKQVIEAIVRKVYKGSRFSVGDTVVLQTAGNSGLCAVSGGAVGETWIYSPSSPRNSLISCDLNHKYTNQLEDEMLGSD
eukprot:NODE_9268_length_652_cov_141.455577_g9002_i0.p1 GENE.NODE_9268_length_652_cov_141.455577_g9002_i0~~NODE_9268_length_652_cov_141.455577_g9002_i0.p1  ORF type:complete len:158 (+),score=20.98 NODE_9268_length_652_cov_141.455577_g9002_i0:56-475(+)